MCVDYDAPRASTIAEDSAFLGSRLGSSKGQWIARHSVASLTRPRPAKKNSGSSPIPHCLCGPRLLGWRGRINTGRVAADRQPLCLFDCPPGGNACPPIADLCLPAGLPGGRGEWGGRILSPPDGAKRRTGRALRFGRRGAALDLTSGTATGGARGGPRVAAGDSQQRGCALAVTYVRARTNFGDDCRSCT